MSTRTAAVIAAVLTLIIVGLLVGGAGRKDGSAALRHHPSMSLAQGVAVTLAHPSQKTFFSLDAKLDHGVTTSGKGEYDGDGIALDGSRADFYAYGPDADALWKVMKPIVEAAGPKRGSYAELEYGPIEKRSTRIVRVELP
jgi:hypothetical protein